MRRAHVKVFGEVHNVGFRSLTKHRANKLRVSGWIRNNSDGTVEAVFEGKDKEVQDMIDWCHKGPPTSFVEKVEVRDETYRGEFSGFSIIGD